MYRDAVVGIRVVGKRTPAGANLPGRSITHAANRAATDDAGVRVVGRAPRARGAVSRVRVVSSSGLARADPSSVWVVSNATATGYGRASVDVGVRSAANRIPRSVRGPQQQRLRGS